MTKKLVVLIILNCLRFFVAANDFNFSLKNSLQYQNSFVTESVFESDSIISKLTWNQPFQIAYKLEPGFSYKNLSLNAEISSCIPFKNGTTKDYDYLTTNEGEISNYSEHDLYLDKSYSVGISLSYTFNLGKLHLTPGCGFSYTDQKYSAQDGFYQYPDISGTAWTGNEKKTSLTGIILSYEQAAYYPLILLDINFDFTENLKLGLSGNFKAFGTAYALDSHYIRSTQFYDYSSQGLGFNINTCISYKHKNNVLTFSLGYDWFSAEGESAENSIGTNAGKLVKDQEITSKIESKYIYIRCGIEFYPFK